MMASTSVAKEEGQYHAATVASFLINKAIDNGRPLTQLQLQKIIVIAHGYCLALLDTPLVKESIEAWRYGPVIPQIYATLKQYGRKPITSKIYLPEPVNEQDPVIQVLQQILNRYGDLTAGQLISLTHGPKTPWTQFYTPGQNNTIPDYAIKTHYQELIAHANA